MTTRLLERLIVPLYVKTRTTPLNLVRGCEKVVSTSVDFTQVRNYAKGKDRGKDKKAKGGGKVEINPTVMAELVPVEKLKERCQSAIVNMKEDFAKNLSLRSTTGAIDALPIKHDGKDYELQELAQIVRKNPKTIVINFASFPQVIPDVLKAISTSGLNLNPQQDGTTLYVPVPKVTKEHREALAKNAKALYIKCRDTVKDIQNEYIKKSKKQTGVSEDLVFNVNKQTIALCEQYLEEAKEIYNNKHNELLGK
ncbi:ribosome-recycling factor, mitochondrial [Pararge aegeria]|uniref:Ribosome-recycling factor, mitochondrial n=1 Tax=Pararge aegeria aegeria TaxID=348720 RepID=A0A8S4S755_9NEOP|nr:ribosome-recycling factor, mitochondrial [Pararge aegeria]CAH2243639.1 jg23564 [Pararge aegeria aegeria]